MESILHALYDLTTHPEYVDRLRDEILSVLDSLGGFTKHSLLMMRKLDSCLRESQRLNLTASLPMARLAIRDYTFTSGRKPFTIHKGTTVAAPAAAIHRAPYAYGPDADEWKGFRFSEMCGDKDEATRNQLASTSKEFLSFGHGRDACPGRFYAANELKLIMCYLLLRYDIRLPEECQGKRPPNIYRFGGVRPDTTVDLEFRRREQWSDLENRWNEAV